MMLAVDVDYRDPSAKVAGIAFQQWEDHQPSGIYVSHIESTLPYVPGRFYQRELPCILHLISEHALHPAVIIVDGFVHLDAEHTPGLGQHLFDALQKTVLVIGVAKRPFHTADPSCTLYRGQSTKPLYITAAGLDVAQACLAISRMSGKYRIPHLLKMVDRICRA